MCIDYSDATDVTGAAHAGGRSIDVARTVVAFTHPMELQLEHALCIDFRADNGDPSERVAVELDVTSARELAYSILGALSISPSVGDRSRRAPPNLHVTGDKASFGV